jgi:hypothetical protein
MLWLSNRELLFYLTADGDLYLYRPRKGQSKISQSLLLLESDPEEEEYNVLESDYAIQTNVS